MVGERGYCNGVIRQAVERKQYQLRLGDHTSTRSQYDRNACLPTVAIFPQQVTLTELYVLRIQATPDIIQYENR